jgi:hypothetical protein
MHEWTYLQLPALSFMLTGYALGALLPTLVSITWRRHLKSSVALNKAVKNLGFTIARVSSLAGCVLSLYAPRLWNLLDLLLARGSKVELPRCLPPDCCLQCSLHSKNGIEVLK